MFRSSRLLPLFLLVLIFVMPVLLAWYGVNKGHWSGAHVNHGYLFQPAVELNTLVGKNIDGPAFSWQNNAQKWGMVYVVPPVCDASCHHAIYMLHQVRIALNQDQDRFIRVLVFLSPPESKLWQSIQADANAKGMHAFILDEKALRARLKQDPVGKILILDPQQRAVLAYATDVNPSLLLKDLQRLMRVFHLGQDKA
ncbi:MAG: hypothetical protein HY939_02630 [Gammaproteobacteria bacterium]|nr:hypothetical protein [Gammaproteobacteria bacterium]